MMQERKVQIPEALIQQIEEKHRKYFTQLLRFDRFRRDETPQEWVELLGPDVLLATHSKSTSDLVLRFLLFCEEEGEPLDQESSVLLLTAARNHDWGEIVIGQEGVGDVSFDQKTKEDEQTEITIFEKVCQNLPKGSDLDLIKKAYYEVVQQREGLGELFNLVERIGYWLTALRAYQGSGGARIENWRGLVGNVFSNQTEDLVNCARKYQFINNILFKNSQEASLAFRKIIHCEEIPIDKYGNLSFDSEKFKHVYEIWQVFNAPN